MTWFFKKSVEMQKYNYSLKLETKEKYGQQKSLSEQA